MPLSLGAMPMLFRLLIVAILPCATIAPLIAEEPSLDFARDVRPILQRHCLECHGPKVQKGKLRLDTRDALQKKSELAVEILRRVGLPKTDVDVMPSRGEPLTSEQVAILSRWIKSGAPWPAKLETTKHWAFVAPVRPTITGKQHPIDQLVRARLSKMGMEPAPEADRAVLLRRVTLDLTGLPPTPKQFNEFLKDERPDAYERLVDALLAAPQFGEKWARPWLDLAHYADSHGFQRDDLRDLWPYRDWVIRALNDDMPFDRFTIDQLAGDLLPSATQTQKIATGFGRCSPTNVEAGSDPEETRVNQVIDRVNTMSATWLGVTIECVQCHDHKYDPFTQKDYYGLFAYMNNTALEADRSNPKVPGSIRFLGPTLTLKPFPPFGKPLTTLVMQELDKPRVTRVFGRGDFRTPKEVVTPHVPAILNPVPEGPANRHTLARWLVDRRNPLTARVQVNRLWAELFGRGLVSTVEDFGVKGEPPTHPDLLDWLACEFMEPTTASSQPWSTKHVLRTIVNSASYKQSSHVSTEILAKDDRNLWLARGPRFRLDAEAIRDNALAAAGLLNLKQFGPPIRPHQPDGLWSKVGGEKIEYVVSIGDEKYRRGIYVIWKRCSPYPSFMNFDAIARLTCTTKRSRTNTPLQALTLLNDPVYVEAAFALARRAVTERPAVSLDGQLEHAFRLCVTRSPNVRELSVLKNLFEQQRSAYDKDPARTKLLLGASKIPQGVTAAEFAAWYAVATAILNLDETITKG